MTIITFVSANMWPCAELFAPGWTAHAERTVILTDRDGMPAIAGAEIQRAFDRPAEDWITNVRRKVQAYAGFLRRNPDPHVVILDADCQVLKPLHAVFSRHRTDVIATRMVRRPGERHEELNAGVLFLRRPGGDRAVSEWLAAIENDAAWRHQQERRAAPDQHELNRLCMEAFDGQRSWTCAAESERIYNSEYTQKADRAPWLEHIRRGRPAILHHKAGRWKNPQHIAEVRTAVAGAIPPLADLENQTRGMALEPIPPPPAPAPVMTPPQAETGPDQVDLVFMWIPTASPWEIKTAVALARKNLTGIRRIHIFGGNPQIPKTRVVNPQWEETALSAEARMIAKIRAACTDPEVADPFVLASDDHFILRRTHAPTLPRFYKNDMAHRKGFKSEYGQRILRTIQALQARGLPTLNYDCHRPMLIHKAAYLAATDAAVAEGIDVLAKSVYGNSLVAAGQICEDAKDLIMAARHEPKKLAAIVARFDMISTPPDTPSKIRRELKSLADGTGRHRRH